ncbi:MAG TPA: hypothetical protein VFZ65_03505, partial [Planctomycetota bacterium]|nr:hypothetical protein [Planctomycetota bacterium]
MRLQGPRAFWARHGHALVSAAICVYGAIYTIRQVRGGRTRAPGDLENLDLDFRISDFEAFYRCALRMLQGRPMYFTDGTGPLEQPGKQAPFFELLLQPFAPFGIGLTAAVFGLVTTLALLSSMRLGRQLVQTSPEPHAARWTPYLASLLLLAPLQLNFLYFQTGILLVWLFLLGMRL